VHFATSTRSLAAQAHYIPYGPTRKSSMALLEPALRERLPTAGAHMASALKLDARWWSEHLERIGPRFERWRKRPVMVPRSPPR
jgi:putative spermidine/putrescine transport system substrate-binding protein